MAKKHEETTAVQTEAPPAPQGIQVIGSNAMIPMDLADDMEQYAGAGTSDRREENVIPFLRVLQKTSPQVNKKDPAYVEGAEPGLLYNTASRRLIKAEDPGTGPLALQAHADMYEVEWIPRAAGGGFVAQHPIDTPLLKEVMEVPNPQDPTGKRTIRMLPNGHQLVTTAYHYLVMVDTLEAVVLGLSSTGLQTHRAWNTMLRNKKLRGRNGLIIAPSFATVVRLRTFWQQNERGDWYSLAVEDEGFVTAEQRDAYEEAKKFFNLAMAGELKAATPPDDDAATTINGSAEDPGEGDDSPL